MNTVDKEEAAKRAREKAHRQVALMFNRANTPDAHREWSRIFWREYIAYVSPLPSSHRGGKDME